ncbi:hypothetical protein [Crassaminicella profunda]|uniref:hypothetical protein n=1 Tax=Crassaminicella profunda TaxID=1286698 RepID=UPI001CA73F32|nr:hypothetical protein [Crassaminicella profunda]QZY55784.1 hypothetical protein K7H06_01840 [Crassaminicella profunda]
MKIKTYSGKKTSIWVKIMLILFGGVLIIVNVLAKECFGIISGSLLIYLSTYKKEVNIISEGIKMDTTCFWMKHEQVIYFKNMTHLKIEQIGDKTILHCVQQYLGRKIIVDTKSIEKVMDWVQEKNNKIVIETVPMKA